MTGSFPATRSAVMVGAAFTAPTINKGADAFAAGPRAYSRRAVDLVSETLVFDMLAPLNCAFRDRIDIDGFDHPRKIIDLTEELIRCGYSNDNIRAVLGGNFRRLLTQVWG